MTCRNLRTLASAVVLAVVGTALAYPKPASVPTRWELEFAPGPLRLYVDPVDEQAYWYFTYKITNRTGRDQVWAPQFTVFTDAGEILVSGRGVPSGVTDGLVELLGNPLLEVQNALIGEIFHGREHARDGLVVWPAGNLQVNTLSLFIAGISGETATIRNPITGEQSVLRKTLKRDYLIPGEVLPRGSQPAGLVGQSWVMR
jgi:hypothetical protein